MYIHAMDISEVATDDQVLTLLNVFFLFGQPKHMSHVLNPGSHVMKGGPCKDLRRKQNTGRRKPA